MDAGAGPSTEAPTTQRKKTKPSIPKQHKDLLADYWSRGMTSSKPGTAAGNLFAEAMQKTGLTKKTIQNFIGGKRKRMQIDSGCKQRNKPFKLSTAINPKPRTENRRLYTAFQRQYMQGRGNEDRSLMMKAMNQQWGIHKNDATVIDKLKKQLEEENITDSVPMTARQKQAAVRVIVMEISKLCKYMKDIMSYDSMFATCHIDHGTAMTGSRPGVGHMLADNKRVMREFQFGVGHQEGSDKPARQFLLSEVQAIFNAKYESATGKKHVEYKAWRDGKVKIDVRGMPSGRCFTEPHRYSDQYLGKIIDVKDELSFTVEYCVSESVEEEDGSASIQEVDMQQQSDNGNDEHVQDEFVTVAEEGEVSEAMILMDSMQQGTYQGPVLTLKRINPSTGHVKSPSVKKRKRQRKPKHSK